MTTDLTILEQIDLQAIELSHGMKQVVGEKRDYYITLEQLEMILEKFVDQPL